MKQLFCIFFICSYTACLFAQCPAYFGSDYSGGKVFIMENNKIVWEHPAIESNDVWALPNGNLLFTTGHGVLEMTRANDTLFSYQSPNAIFACQRLPNGNTFIGESNSGRLLEVSPAGKIVHEACILPAGQTDGGHAFMRNARCLPNGNYLVAHYGGQVVKEYTRQGKLVWQVEVPGGPHSVLRLPNGNTLVSVADMTQNPRIVEFDMQGNVVWELSNKDFPDAPLKFLGGMQYLPDGRLYFTNWVGHEHPATATHLFCVNKQKQVLYRQGTHEGLQTMSSLSFLNPEAVTRNRTYTNPVIPYSLPDPTIIKAPDGYFYLYATENIRNVPIHRSRNLVDWEEIGTAFTNETRPTFEPEGAVWALDINYINGQYVLYYSMSVWGGEWTCGIGVATAARPEGPFTDKGMLFRSNTIQVQNSIDPYYIEDQGKKYLFWGSFRGIYGIELANDGLTVKKNAVKKQIAGTAYEGTYIHKKGAYYYLFASVGSCCEGLKSTYKTVVGRSKHLFGPYVDKNGKSMLDNHHELLIQGNNAFVGTGHNSEIVQDEAGTDWMFYHGVDKSNPEGRVLLMDRVDWHGGWPVVATGSPEAEAPVPVFNTSTTYTNPLPVQFGDPYVLLASNGTYYMYGTGAGAVDGFCAYSSSDLANWTSEGQVYQGNTSQSWALANFWAPEVYERNGKYYMFFSADWKVNPSAEQENFRIGVAVADQPTGPFRELSDRPLFDPGYPAIDGNLVEDTDGRLYLYFSRCCYKHLVESEVATWAKAKGMFNEIEESWIYGVELKPDLSGIIGEPVLILRPPVTNEDAQAEWESRSVTSGEVNRRWTEGSYTFKQGDTFYMMYSANFFGGKNYAVGYATATNPLGPFTKAANNPVLQKNVERGGTVTGTGHNSITRSRDGKQLYCVYHGRTQATGDERVVFIDRMGVDKKGDLYVEGPTTTPQSIP